MFTILKCLGALYVTPRSLLGILPIKRVREAHFAFIEWTKYIQELREDGIDRLEEISGKKSARVSLGRQFSFCRIQRLLSLPALLDPMNGKSLSASRKDSWEHLLHTARRPRDDWEHHSFRTKPPSHLSGAPEEHSPRLGPVT